MEKISVSKLKISDYNFREHYECTISKPVGNRLSMLRVDKDNVIIHKDSVKGLIYLMEKLELAEYNKVVQCVLKNRVMVTYSLSTTYTFVKVKCSDPDVGLAYYMGHKKGIKYFNRKEIKRLNKNETRTNKRNQDKNS